MPVLKPIDRYTLGFKEGYKSGRFATKQEFDAVVLEKLGTTQSTAKDAINEINATLAETLIDSGVEADATAQTTELIAKIPDIPNYSEHWNAVTNNGTFYKNLFMANLELVHAPYIDLSKCTNAFEMFKDCYALQTVNLSKFTVPTSYHSMFLYCESLEYVPDLNFIMATGQHQYVFKGCKKLKRIDGIVDLTNASGSYDGQEMFRDCESLEEVTVAGRYLFPVELCYNCKSLKSFKIVRGIWSNRGAHRAFYNCTALTDVEFDLLYGEYIKEDLSFQYSPLTAQSAKNIILNLYPTANFNVTITFSEYTIEQLQAEGNTSPNGNTWEEYLDDIGWLH